MTQPFRLGVPNTGRLSQLVGYILANKLNIIDARALTSRRYVHIGSFRNSTIEVIFARSEDLPRLVNEKAIDACITGRDYVYENAEHLHETVDLKLCPGTVSLLVPKKSEFFSLHQLEGKIIATQLPKISRNWIRNNAINAKIRHNIGANEVYPYLGLADATIDVVSTGETAKQNGMHPVVKILSSSGRLFASERALNIHRDILDGLRADLIKVLELEA